MKFENSQANSYTDVYITAQENGITLPACHLVGLMKVGGVGGMIFPAECCKCYHCYRYCHWGDVTISSIAWLAFQSVVRRDGLLR